MTPAALAKEILRLHRAGEALNISAVKKNHPDLLDAAYAFRPFLGWKQAIEKAGLDYKSIRIALEPYVACRICGEHMGLLGKHLSAKHGVTVSEYREEFPGAPAMSEEFRSRSSFGSRYPVVEPHWEPLLSMEYVRDRAWFWYSRHGYCNRDFIRNNDPAIINYSTRMKSSWDDVIRSLDLDPKVIRADSYPDVPPDEIIQFLRTRRRWGIPNTSQVITKEFPGVHQAILRHFGSYRRAVRASGLSGNSEVAPALRESRLQSLAAYPDPPSVVAALRALAVKGISPGQEALMRTDPVLGSAIYLHFPNHIAALEAAGLKVKNPYRLKSDFSSDHAPTGKPSRYPGAAEVIAEIRDRHRRGRSILMMDVVREDNPLKSAAFSCCGSWRNAIRQAGLEEELQRIIAAGVRKDAVYASAQAVRRALIKRAREGLPLAQNQVINDDYPLKTAAYRYFGSWPAAIEAAGLTERWKRQKTAAFRARNPSAYPTRRSIIEAFRERAAAGHSLAYADVNRDSPLLRSKTYEFFPSWPAAIKAAGLTRLLERQKLASRPYAAYPSRGAVIKAAKQRVVAGLPLTHTALRRDDPALQSALHHFFGPSWNAAIRQVIAPS